ncbi:MAG: hypothetical protein AB4352_25705 [Hormoscilla sp.]
MNAHTFDSDYPRCPICQRPLGRKRFGLDSGLYICSYCQERLVVSQSGHYVRDPFAIVQPASGRLGLDIAHRKLRRQSRPIARMMRDLGVRQRLPQAVYPTLYIIASVMFLSFTLAAAEGVPSQGLSKLLERAIDSISSIKE